jgi:hypothetical protein
MPATPCRATVSLMQDLLGGRVSSPRLVERAMRLALGPLVQSDDNEICSKLKKFKSKNCLNLKYVLTKNFKFENVLNLKMFRF